MNLYYTTTTGYDQEQPNPDRSLGGYKSSTRVVNDDFNNIFDEISIMTIRSGRDEYRAIVIKNEYTTRIDNLQVRITAPEDAICTYKLAVGEMNIVDKYRRVLMENVATINNKPFHATFVDMSEPDVVLQVGSLEPGQEIGLWVCRHVNQDEARLQYETVCEPDPNDPQGRIYREVTHPTVESINVDFTWT